ncbi:MAG: hypothetical protein KF753_06550 [Caldilineaceae bacterium]|nr:hypothetical protein [Caldilineaceae bacterium]
MHKTLRLNLLGPPQIFLDDQPLEGFSTNKAKALLFYLTVTAAAGGEQPAPHSRDSIAALLWGEMTNSQAKKNLRAVLPNLRQLLGDHLRIDRQTIAFDKTAPYWLDVEVLRAGVGPGQSSIDSDALQAAVDLYAGEFLHGFYVQNAPDFEAWVLEQRESLHTWVVQALFRLVGEYIEGGKYLPALTANRRLLLMNPWSEPAHRQQMLLLARTGERSAALAQFEECRQMLAEEFGVEPLAETLALYAQIRRAGPGEGEDNTGARFRETQLNTSYHKQPTPELAAQLARQNLPPSIKLYGRHADLAAIRRWVEADGCQLVGIFGIGGQGKTTLAAALARWLADERLVTSATPGPTASAGFTRILWQSLVNAPPLGEVVQAWLYALSDQRVGSLPANPDQQLHLLLDYLAEERTLLILDNVESILDGDERSGYYRQGYAPYGQLLRRMAAGGHRSCLLFTSRERPHDLIALEEDTPAVRFLSLAGLPAEAGKQMIVARGVVDNDADPAALVQHYSGNPLALKLAAETVHSLFDGNVAAFLQMDSHIFDDIRDVLDQQFARLAPLEQKVVIWLAIAREPISYTALAALLAQPPSSHLLLEAIRSLQRRSLLEKYPNTFGLQNVVMEYCTERLVETVVNDLLDEDLLDAPPGIPSALHSFIPASLHRYALILAQSKEYIRASQTRLILTPIADRLVARLGYRGTEQRLRSVLAQLRTVRPVPGYAAANLLHLLLHLGVELAGTDFSRLYLRQLYLRGVTLPRTNFAQAEIVDSVFSEPFGLVYTAVFSRDGGFLAAGTGEGDIYLWRTSDQKLTQVLSGHSQSVNELAFGQRVTERGKTQWVLVSASADQQIGYWVLAADGQTIHATCLRHEQQGILLAVGLHPNGQRVTGVDDAGTVSVWEVSSGQSARLVRKIATHPTRLRLVAFSGDGRFVAVGNREGTVQVCDLITGEIGPLLTAPTGSIVALALSRDGEMLIAGGKEGHLCCWSLPAGQVEQVLETEAGVVDALAFSPDDSLLVSSHQDLAVRVWRVGGQRALHLLHTLPGHTQVIWSVAFGLHAEADSSGKPGKVCPRIVSGSSDQTVRVWDAETGQAFYALAGQPRALSALAIQPLSHCKDSSPQDPQAEWVLAAVGYDGFIHLWQGWGAQAAAGYRSLPGACGPLFSVAISPDGCTIASGGKTDSIDLWRRANGEHIQRLHGHSNSILSLAFHPAGELLASGSTDGTVRLWRLPDGPGTHGQALAVLQPNLHSVYAIAFRPDGRVLAAASADISLRFWDITQYPPVELIDERRSVQAEGEHDIFSIGYSPDGRRVACGGHRVIHIWDTQNKEAAPLILRRHTDWIFSLAFGPDGAVLASGGADCSICLWNAAEGTLAAVLTGHTDTIYSVVFTPDGSGLASCSFDGTVRFWDVQTGACVNSLHVEGPYAGMNIAGVTGISEAQKAALKALGAVGE